jgi:hypothetical protein
MVLPITYHVCCKHLCACALLSIDSQTALGPRTPTIDLFVARYYSLFDFSTLSSPIDENFQTLSSFSVLHRNPPNTNTIIRIACLVDSRYRKSLTKPSPHGPGVEAFRSKSNVPRRCQPESPRFSFFAMVCCSSAFTMWFWHHYGGARAHRQSPLLSSNPQLSYCTICTRAWTDAAPPPMFEIGIAGDTLQSRVVEIADQIDQVNALEAIVQSLQQPLRDLGR